MMDFLLGFFNSTEPLGEVKYCQLNSRKWKWKVIGPSGSVISRSNTSYYCRAEAVQSFLDMQDIVKTIE